MANVSFSLSGDGGVVTQQSTFDSGGSTSFSGGPSGAGQSSGSVAGGGNALDFAQHTASMGLKNVDALNKLAGGMIQGYIDKAKKEQYAQGMAMAAQGKALIDIENDQPWYSKLYGPDATVQGAQAFNMAAAMQDAQSQFMQAMPQLREKSPDQVRAYIVQKMGEVKPTGDGAFDAMVQQGLAEQLPKMLQTHMSQYMQFTQEQNYNGFTNLGTSGAQALQDTLKAGNNLNDEQVAQANAGYTNLLARPDNMTSEAYSRGLRDVMLGSAQKGNWAAVRAIKQMPEYQSMPTEMKDNLEVQIPKLEQQWALQNPAARNLFTSRADLHWSLSAGASGIDSSPDGHAQLDHILDTMEASNRKLNGDATPVYNNAQRAQMHELLDKGNAARLAQMQKAQMKQLNYDQSLALATGAYNDNSFSKYEGLDGFDKGAASQAADTLFTKTVGFGAAQQADAEKNGWDKLSTSANYSTFQSPQLKQILNQQLPALVSGNGPGTADMQTALGYASKLLQGPGGESAVEAYVGKDAHKVIALLNSGINIMDPDQLKQERELLARSQGVSASPQDVKAAQAIVQQADPGWFKRMMPWVSAGDLQPYELTDGNKAQLANAVAPLMAQYKAAYHLSDDQASKLALGQAMRNSDFVPGAFILHNAALGQTSFAGAVNAKYPGMGDQTTAIYQQAVQYAIDEQLKSGGVEPKDWKVTSGENLGNGYMTLFMTNSNGQLKHINISADTVGKRIQDTYGNKPEHSNADLGLTSKNAWGWAY
ncbi:hypothetical protein [Paraburkholderia youngii]|uniref:Uncharacterized protein n=1 Tax=Paraburkholderia youngii TaxID=2782701 RepID=A0A7Y6JVN6_9BURK|nr:hypothetical protein [Paraburkholderia youngii]NUX98784.1 hypothetical protein [Paraburkholderia youngii]